MSPGEIRSFFENIDEEFSCLVQGTRQIRQQTTRNMLKHKAAVAGQSFFNTAVRRLAEISSNEVFRTRPTCRQEAAAILEILQTEKSVGFREIIDYIDCAIALT